MKFKNIAELLSEWLLMMLPNELAMPKYMPKFVNFEQSLKRMTVSQELLNELDYDAERSRIGYKTWVYRYQEGNKT